MRVSRKLRSELLPYLQNIISPERQDRIEAVMAQRTRHLTVVLEGIYHGHNASAVLRSCDCFGVQDVHLIPRPDADPFQAATGISLGASQWLTVKRYPPTEDADNTAQAFAALRDAGYRIVGTTLRPGAIPIHELDIKEKTALCFGSERDGLSEHAHELADELVYVPMQGFTQSLNVSVAAALCLFELTRRLRQSDSPWHLSEAECEVLRFSWSMRSVKHRPAILRRYFADRGEKVPPELLS